MTSVLRRCGLVFLQEIRKKNVLAVELKRSFVAQAPKAAQPPKPPEKRRSSNFQTCFNIKTICTF